MKDMSFSVLFPIKYFIHSMLKFPPILTNDGGSIDTLHYNLSVSDFKCEH